MAPAPNYNRVAPVYDAASRLFSFGQIRQAKLAQLDFLKPADKVLYLGAGGGEEAVRAAARGVDVTCIDLSAAMVERTRERLARRGARADLIVGDVLAHSRAGHYDAVAGNFFFNVFAAEAMPAFLAHAVTLIRPGGKLMIADIAPPTGSLPGRLFNRAYSGAAMGLFRAAGLVAWHPTYDYPAHFSGLGLVEEWRRDFPLFSGGPVMFRTVIGRKEAG